MGATKRKARAINRDQLARRGLVSIEVVVPKKDKALLESFAANLIAAAETSSEPAAGKQVLRTGGDIWDALLASPLAGSDIDFERIELTPREVKLGEVPS